MVQDAALAKQRTGIGVFNPAFSNRQEGRAGVKTETLRLTQEEAAQCAVAMANYKDSREKPLEAMDLTARSFSTLVRLVRNSRKDLTNLRPEEQLELREFSGLVSLMMKDLGDLCHSKEYDIRTQALGLVMKYTETIRQLEGLITTSKHEDIHLGIVKHLASEISRLKMESRTRQQALPRIGDLEVPDYHRRLILRVGVLSRFEAAREKAVLFFADSLDSESLNYIATHCSEAFSDFRKTRDHANAELEKVQQQVKDMGGRSSSLLSKYISVVPSPPPAVEGGKVIQLRPRQKPEEPGPGDGAAVALPKPNEEELGEERKAA
ncbi:TPA: hypothetical protein HA238_05215 [Candidatus Micrarchaeota archaeon]|nr:hypothetical protein [Candidatus Micrarchaeota archaeon]